MASSPFIDPVEPVCPKNLLDLAKAAGPCRTAIVRASSLLPMEAAKDAVEEGIMTPVFIGERDGILSAAEQLDWDITGFELIETTGEDEAATIGAELARDDKVEALMKGHLHSDNYMKAIIMRRHKLMTRQRLFHLFHISEPRTGKPLIIGDAAVNVSPSLEARKSGLRAIDRLAKKVGIERPKIAILSATETPTDTMPSSVEAARLAEWAKTDLPSSDVSGPLSIDLILSEESAATKGLHDDPVAGKADAILVPDIVSGNAIFKSLVYLAGGCAAGVVMGAKLPILLTSRSDPAAARLASSALASILRGSNG